MTLQGGEGSIFRTSRKWTMPILPDTRPNNPETQPSLLGRAQRCSSVLSCARAAQPVLSCLAVLSGAQLLSRASPFSAAQPCSAVLSRHDFTTNIPAPSLHKHTHADVDACTHAYAYKNAYEYTHVLRHAHAGMHAYMHTCHESQLLGARLKPGFPLVVRVVGGAAPIPLFVRDVALCGAPKGLMHQAHPARIHPGPPPLGVVDCSISIGSFGVTRRLNFDSQTN